MNKDEAREAARLGFTLPGEEPLDKVAFDCGYKAGAASVDRRAVSTDRRVEIAFQIADKLFNRDVHKRVDLCRFQLSQYIIAGIDKVLGAASVDRRAIVEKAFKRFKWKYASRDKNGHFPSQQEAMDAVLAEMEANNEQV